MQIRGLTGMIIVFLVLAGCRTGDEAAARQFGRLKEEGADRYTLAYHRAVYLSTARDVEIGFAISLLNEMIADGYPTEARYCIDNLNRNGIRSGGLLALRGLCYQHEMQYELAMADFRAALVMDPEDPRIRELILNLKASRGLELTEDEILERARELMDKGRLDESESLLKALLEKSGEHHEATYCLGLVKLGKGQYDSAYRYIQLAEKTGDRPRSGEYITHIASVLEGETLIGSNPHTFSGYLKKSRGLASMGFFDRAQQVLDGGLESNPDNVNLIMAKALVWVQAGERETAEVYLLQQEQRGIRIDPGLKRQVLTTQN